MVTSGPAAAQRWSGAERAGHADALGAEAVVEHPPQRWGLAARGALVEAGAPEFHFTLGRQDRSLVAPTRRASTPRRRPRSGIRRPAIALERPFDLPDEVEDAVVQVMTYLVENETAALVVPSRFIAQMHPHFREVMQVLAIQAADEARHIEVFTRRALLKRARTGAVHRRRPGIAARRWWTSRISRSRRSCSRCSARARFCRCSGLSNAIAPDPVTAAVCRLAAQDEARHVAFGMSHLREHMNADPALRQSLMNAVRRRHEALRHTAGLNAEVFDALVLMAAGSWELADIGQGHDRVAELMQEMHVEPQKAPDPDSDSASAEAEEMSSLHTRNFM